MLILHARKTFRVRASEWMLAFFVFGWGVVLLQPTDTFAISPSYGQIASWASEGTWGWFCTIGGAARLGALLLNGAVRPTPHIRALLALLCAFFFFQISLGFVLQGLLVTGLPVYMTCCVFDLYNSVQAAEDAALIDRQRKEGRAKNATGTPG